MKQILIVLAILAMIFLMAGRLFAQEPINVERLATSILKAEGNPNYGIISKNIKGHNFRKACIQTIQNRIHLWDGSGDFISYLGSSYAPIGAKNDPNNLNKNWVKNVTYFYRRLA